VLFAFVAFENAFSKANFEVQFLSELIVSHKFLKNHFTMLTFNIFRYIINIVNVDYHLHAIAHVSSSLFPSMTRIVSYY